MPTVQPASRARFELTHRIATFLESREAFLSQSRGAQIAGQSTLLEEIVCVTNDLMPLFASYEASVLHECLRDVRDEVYGALIDYVRGQIAGTDNGQNEVIGALERQLAFLQRERALLRARQGMERAGDIGSRVRV